MGDIIENQELDQDTVGSVELNQLFRKKYMLMAETAVSLRKTYVTRIDGTKTLQLVVGLSDNTFEVYQLHNSSLQRVCRLSGHKNTLTEVVCSPKQDHLVYTAGHDGVVKLWDTRANGSCVMEYKDEDDPLLRPFECMDISCNGLVLCAGSQVVQDDAYLVFWDQRQPKPLGGYWNSHTDDITQVKFHKDKTEILATGSVDGLMNVFDIMERTEDDALTFSLNVEASVEKISWLSSTRAACLTQSNDIQIWDTFDGELVDSYTRDEIARSIKRSRYDDCYLVDAFSTAENKNILLAGSYSHNGEVLRSVSMADSRLHPVSMFGENKQVVRSCWYDKDRDLLVTTGEAGLVSVWSGCDDDEDMPLLHKTHNKLHANRHRPY